MANSAKYNAYKIPTEDGFDDKYVDFSSAQSITGTKTFNTIKATTLYIGDYLSWHINNYTNHGKTWELLAPDNQDYSIQLGDCGFTVDTREDYNMFQVDNVGVHIGRGRLDDNDYPVDNIVNSIDSSSTDKQLATAKAIFSFFQSSGDFKKFNFIQFKPTDAENRRSGYYIVDGAVAKFGLPSNTYQWGTIVQYYNDSTATAISGGDNKSFVQIYFPDNQNYFYIRSFYGNENAWLSKWNVLNGATGNITWGWHKISASSNEINMGSGLSFSNNTTDTMYIPAAFSSTDILHFLRIMQSAGHDMTPSASSTVSSYVQIGNILICWGVCHPASVGNDTTTTVSFPKSFYWYPTVVMQNTNKSIGIEYRNGQVLTGLTGSSFSYYNSAGEISNILWIAIGKAQSF
nr:MAG TPA: putative tail fiber protein [Caudoviricetes sp.]